MQSSVEEKTKEFSITAAKERKIEFIKDAVCTYYTVEKSILLVKSRTRERIKVVHTIMYFIDRNVNVGPSEIGRHFNCDHATVLHAIKKIRNHAEFDKDLRNEIDEIQRIIKHKGDIVLGGKDLVKDYYFIDLNNVTSKKREDGKSIILSGFTKDEIDNIIIADGRFTKVTDARYFFLPNAISREHKNTGIYILEKKDE